MLEVILEYFLLFILSLIFCYILLGLFFLIVIFVGWAKDRNKKEGAFSYSKYLEGRAIQESSRYQTDPLDDQDIYNKSQWQ
jgi:hypothetical protein